jgi:hypothetical protein
MLGPSAPAVDQQLLSVPGAVFWCGIQYLSAAQKNCARAAQSEQFPRTPWILDQIELRPRGCADCKRVDDQIRFEAIFDNEQSGYALPHNYLLSNCRANPGNAGFFVSGYGKL